MTILLNKSATELGLLLQAGDVSSLQLTELYFDRIATHDPSLHAFTYLAHRSAKAAAKKWDHAKKRGKQPPGPLSGVPTGIKDLSFVRGMPTRFGTRAVPSIRGAVDSAVAKRIRAAGMIICGKLATSEFGAMPVTETDLQPATANPFGLEYTAGGSSGGSGAAVSAGLLPIAQGSDGAGSLRIPAAVNHLVALKSTRGLISPTSPVDGQLRLSSLGGLARTVEDLAAFLDILSDWPHNFSHYHSQPLPTGLRIGLTTSTKICETPEEYKQAAESIAKIFETQGASIVFAPLVDIDLDSFLILWKRLMANAPLVMESRLQPITAWLRKAGKAIPKQEALAARIAYEHTILDWFGDKHLWITPTIAMETPKIGAWRHSDPETSFGKVVGMGAFTAAFNVSGQPAISVPVGFSRAGLPIGVQIAGRVGSDMLVMQAASFLEKHLGTFKVPSPLP